MKSASSVLRLLICSLPLWIARAVPPQPAQAIALSTAINFIAPDGYTTTDATGIYYWTGVSETKIYTSEFWGTFPGYYRGTTANLTYALTNTTPQGNRPYRLKVQAITNVLELDGSAGAQIDVTQQWIVESLLPGQTATLPVSVAVPSDTPSGLYITKFSIFHLNAANDSGEDDTVGGLVDVEWCAWCPPPRPEAN
jgi:hypothetical protein